MVTPIASRPAPLTQRQVDDLAGGRHAGLASALHLARSTPPASARAMPIGRGPVALSAQEMKSIGRGPGVTPALAQRIEAASPSPAASRTAKGSAKAKPTRATSTGKAAGRKPSLKPPLPSSDD